MVEAIKRATVTLTVGVQRSLSVILAVVAVIGTHEGKLPGYTAAVYASSPTLPRYLVAPGYWEDWPILLVIGISLLGVVLTTLKNWKPDAKPPA